MKHLYELLNLKLGGGKALEKYLNQATKSGKSYREMSAELSKKTGIDVSKSSLHLWNKIESEA